MDAGRGHDLRGAAVHQAAGAGPDWAHSDADIAFKAKVMTPGTASQPEAPPITAAGPALEWARVNGSELALRFEAPLDESSVPAAGAFAVSVAGSARTVSAVAVSQATVTLTLAEAVTSGQAVTVGYTPPSTGGLRASGGGAAVAAFTGQAVTNDTPARQVRAGLTASVAGAPAEHRGKGSSRCRSRSARRSRAGRRTRRQRFK